MRRGHEAEGRDETNQPASPPSTSRERGQPGVSQQGGGHALPTRGQPATPPARPPLLRATDTLAPARSQKVPSCTRPRHSRKASHTSTQDKPRPPAQGAREEMGSPQGLAAPPEPPRPVTEDRERVGSDHRRPHRSELGLRTTVGAGPRPRRKARGLTRGGVRRAERRVHRGLPRPCWARSDQGQLLRGPRGRGGGFPGSGAEGCTPRGPEGTAARQSLCADSLCPARRIAHHLPVHPHRGQPA